MTLMLRTHSNYYWGVECQVEVEQIYLPVCHRCSLVTTACLLLFPLHLHSISKFVEVTRFSKMHLILLVAGRGDLLLLLKKEIPCFVN